MPQVYDNINMRNLYDSLHWNFENYIPDVVTVCLGQNDGIQDSTAFCSAYVSFLKRLRSHYPKAQLICLTSPMADSTLSASQKQYITGIESSMHYAGDKNIHHYFFMKRYYHGCDTHPDVAEHKEIADELTGYLTKLMNW